MYSIVQKRRWYYFLSLAIIIPGLIIVVYSIANTGKAFKLSIDFEGGSIYEVKFTAPGADESNIRGVFQQFGNDSTVIQRLGAPEDNDWSIRASYQDQVTSQKIVDALNAIAPVDKTKLRIEQVS